MAGCDDTRQLTEADRQAGYQQQRTGVMQAVRPFSGRPTIENLIDYINRELQPAVKATRNKVNDIYLPTVDNAPSGNPLGFYFSTSTVAADPTVGRIRLNAATQDTATVIRVSESNGRLVNVAPWLDVMSGGPTTPLGVVTLTDALSPARFIRFDLTTMVDQGVYWDLTVSPIESSHDNPFVEGGPVVLSFIPGVGGNTPATVPPAGLSPLAGLSVLGRSSNTTGVMAAITATGRRQFLASNGLGTAVSFQSLSLIAPNAPIYDVMAAPFNAIGDGITDDTVALNAAIAAANTTPGTIFLGPLHRITAALTTVTGNNIRIQGRGEFNGGSRFVIDSVAAIDVLTLTGQYQSVCDIWFVGIRVYTSGWAIRIRNAFRCRVKRCVISQLCFGVEVFRSVLTYLDKVNLDDIYGVFAFWAGGDSGGENHAVTFRSCTYGTSMPGAIVGAGSAWATGTAYAVGAVVTANSGIYQAVQAGTSAAAGTGPSGIPGATNATVHTTQIVDNTVRWVFAMPAAVGFLQDSYCHTFEMIDCGTLQGLYGFSMEDSANTGTSYPQFARARNLQIDHPTSRGVRLAAGGAARFDSTFITSVFGGSGVEVGSAFKGNWEFVGGEIFGCSEAGVVMNKGDGLLCGLQIGACGSASRDCIEVANSASRWTITGCSAGQMFASTTPASRYGLSIAAGCDHYVVEGNRFEGNVTGGILNTPGRSSTRAVLNNIPGVTIAGGSTWGLQIDATSPAVPLEITGAEQGENYRVDTRQTVSVSGTQDIILSDDTTVLVLQLTADTTLRSLRTTATGDGRLVRIEHDTGAFTLTIAHNGATPTYTPFFNPNLADIQVTRAAIVTVRSRSGFWRPEHTGTRMRVRKNSTGTVFDRGRFNVIEGTGMTLTVADDGPNDEVDLTFASSLVGLTDGDKGDITVSSSGTVWTIDNTVVTPAKISNRAALSVFGRASNTSGVGADIVATGADAGFPLRVNAAGTALIYSSVGTLGIDDGAVTLAKQDNLAQSRVIGRAEGAGTGVPQALTPTQIVAIIDAESPTWTGSHTFTGATHTVDVTGLVSIEGDTIELGAPLGGVDVSGTLTVDRGVNPGQVVLNDGDGESLTIIPVSLTGAANPELWMIAVLGSEAINNVCRDTNTAFSSTITNATTTVALVDSIGTIPANSWIVGRTYTIVSHVVVVRGATLTPCNLRTICGLSGGFTDTVDTAIPTLTDSYTYRIEYMLTCLTVGSSGTFMQSVRIAGGSGSLASFGGSNDVSPHTIDTTVSQLITATANMTAGVANLTMTRTTGYLIRTF